MQTHAESENTKALLAKRRGQLEAKGVPRSIAGLLDSENLEAERQAMRTVADWLRGHSRFLTLRGQSYKGKTVAACSAFLAHTFEYEWFAPTPKGAEPVIERSRSWAYGRFVPAATYQGWSKAPFGVAGEVAREKASSARGVHLLVMDDMGTELSDMKALVTDLVSYRTTAWTPQSKMYPSSPLRTIFTTNLTEDELQDLYGDRVLNRLRSEGEIVEAL